MSTSKLSSEALARARAYLAESARPLERARVARRLDGAAPGPVLEALAAFQNPDGGFGRALEPDLRSPSSSPFTTSVAFQVFHELGTPSDDPRVARALEYLDRTFDPGTASWPVTPEDAVSHPHAPWWGRPESARPDPANLNPRSELLGVWLEHRQAVDPRKLAALEEAVRARLAEAGAELEMHELLCVLRLAETSGLEASWREELRKSCEEAARRAVGTSPESWEGYGLRPADVAPRRDSLLAQAFVESVEAYCDHLVATQEPDGSWALPWSWAEGYPEAWALAEREWRGVLIERNLEVLGAWGRLP